MRTTSGERMRYRVEGWALATLADSSVNRAEDLFPFGVWDSESESLVCVTAEADLAERIAVALEGVAEASATLLTQLADDIDADRSVPVSILVEALRTAACALDPDPVSP